MKEWIRVTSARVSSRHVAVCTTVVAGPYDIPNVFVGISASPMSLTCKGNSNSSASETVYSQAFFLSFASAFIINNRKNLREKVLAGVGSRSISEASLIHQNNGEADVACCTFVGLLVILWLLVRGPLCSIFSEKSQEKGFSPFEIHASYCLKTTNLHLHDQGKSFL